MPLKDPEARKAYQREYSIRNREAAYARVKKWREENPEAKAEQDRRYAKKHQDKLREKSLKWKHENIEVVRERNRKSAAEFRKVNPDLIKERKAKYARDNRAVINAAVARRKAAKLRRTPSWLTEEDHWWICEVYELARRRTTMLGFQWHVDHIVPLQGKTVSGLHVPWNLQVIPAKINVSKKNRWDNA